MKQTTMMLKNSSLCLLLTMCIYSCAEKKEILSKEEAMLVAKKIDSSITNKQPRYFDELLDETAFSRKVSKNITSKNSREILKGMRSALDRFDLGDKIIQSLGENGQYELVKHYQKNDTQHLLYRLYAEDGLNYHDLELCKRNGKPGIADIYIYLTGENFSSTIAQLLSSLSENIKESDDRGTTLVQTITRMKDLLSQKEYEKAFNYYKKLPKDLKDQRTVQVMYLLICKGYNDDEYLKALESFQAHFPNDPNIDLLMVDAYLLREDTDKAMAAINKLDSFIDSDPFLDFPRAMISNIANKPDDARKYLERLYKNYPQFGTGVIELIANYIEAEMDEKAKDLIRAYKQNNKFDQEVLENYLFLHPKFQ